MTDRSAQMEMVENFSAILFTNAKKIVNSCKWSELIIFLVVNMKHIHKEIGS
jgi:hypothetical protein